MRKIGRRAAAMISAAALGAGCFLPAGAQAAPEITVREQSPRQAELSVAVSLPEFRQDDFTGELTAVPVYEASDETPQLLAQTGELPSSFDLRAEKTMSPVRDQSGFGTCWAHSACASAEATILGAVPDVDLSEFHTAYYAYEGDDQINLSDMELTERMNYGGTADIVTNLWAQWIGPVKEERIPYGDLDFFSSNQAGAMKYLADYHLENAYIFDYNWEHDNTEEVGALIKELVYSGIPVDISFYNDPSQCYSSLYKSTNSKKRPRFANHSVTIAGWDDSFPKDHFTIPAENDGAWLVKNSWGAKYGSGGYMWISYEDASLSECVAYELTDKKDYQYNHQHDTYVPVQSLCAWEDVSQDTGSYMANVFPIYGDEEIGAVSTYIRSPGTDYEITVYTGLTDKSDPTSGTPSAVTKGSCEKSGYFTFELDRPVYVPGGTDVGVVMKLTNPDDHFVIPLESCIIIDNGQDLISLGGHTTLDGITAYTGENESFFSTDCKEWTDVTDGKYIFSQEEVEDLIASVRRQFYDGIEPDDEEGLEEAERKSQYYEELLRSGEVSLVMGNISLKAFGNDPGTVEFSRISGQVPAGETVELTASAAPIMYSINGGEEQEYTAPIEITQETKISATTDGEHYSQRTYAPDKAQLMALGYQEGDGQAIRIMKHAEKTGEGRFLIDLTPTAKGLRLFPETYSTVSRDGLVLENFALSEFIPIPYGETKLTLDLFREGMDGSSVSLTIRRLPCTIDMEQETIDLGTAETVTAPDGKSLSTGDSLSDYAGQVLTGTIDGETFQMTVPERYALPELKEDMRRETLEGIPAEVCGLVEVSVNGEDFLPAGMRLSEPCDSGTVSMNVIPGEELTLRTKAGNGYFASIPAEYKISNPPEAPRRVTGISVKNGKVILPEDGELQIQAYTENYGHFFENTADAYSYPSLDELRSALEKRTGLTDSVEVMSAANAFWGVPQEIGYGEKIIVRYPATDTSYASKVLITRAVQMGDVDADGYVDSTDASDVLVHFASVSTGEEGTIPADLRPFGDMDLDGKIDSTDASAILVFYAELMTKSAELQ
ncbi:MAG: hypothetical protein J6M48_00480 [Ruminococcus sp.]|nr:hypothetical protein [Ruminococcus sp.]